MGKNEKGILFNFYKKIYRSKLFQSFLEENLVFHGKGPRTVKIDSEQLNK